MLVARNELQAIGMMGPDDEDWQHLGFTSRDLLYVERQVPGFSAQRFFGNVTMGQIYTAAYWTLKRQGKIAEGYTLAQFEAEWDLHLNSPEELAAIHAALMAGLPAPEPEESAVDPTPAAASPTAQ